MAISATNKIAEKETSTAAHTTASYTRSNNKLYLLSVMSRFAGGPKTPTISAEGGGLTWVEVAHLIQGNYKITVFRGLVSSGAGSGTTTIDFGGQTQAQMMCSVDEFSGIKTTGSNGSGAIVQSATSGGSGATSLSITLAAFADATNNASFGSFVHGTSESTTPEAGYTELSDQNNSSTGAQVEWKLTQDLGVSASWASSSACAGIAAEIASVVIVTVAIGQATETDSALAITHQKGKTIGQATETDSALAMTRNKSKTLSQASETDTAIGLVGLHIHVIAQSFETDSAQAVAHYKTLRLGQATETDTAFGLTGQHNTVIGQAEETDSTFSVTPAQVGVSTLASTADSAATLDSVASTNTTPTETSDTHSTLVLDPILDP